jgi:ketosteroid isomerase-like protein
MRSKMRLILPGLFILLGCLAGFKGSAVVEGGAGPTDNKGEEETLRTLDRAWSDAAGRKDLDAVVSYMADDGETLAPNEPAARDKPAIRASWAGLLGLPSVAVRWEPVRAQVAKSGEIGYTSGTYTLSYTGADGQTVRDRGKYLEVWKKVNGRWKCSSDAYNSDLPAK